MSETPGTRPTPEGSSAFVPADEETQSDTTTDAPESTTAPAPSQSAPSTTSADQEDLLARTRVGGTWVAIIIFAIVLVLLLIFILENTQKVDVTYFGQTGTMPLAVAMLLAAV